MIDFWGVLFNLIWILGLAVLLGTWSVARNAARARRLGVQELLELPGYALALNTGLLLVCLGLAATDQRWWASALWTFLALLIVVESTVRLRVQRSKEVDDARESS